MKERAARTPRVAAAALKAKGYDYRYVFCKPTKHCEGKVFQQAHPRSPTAFHAFPKGSVGVKLAKASGGRWAPRGKSCPPGYFSS